MTALQRVIKQEYRADADCPSPCCACVMYICNVNDLLEILKMLLMHYCVILTPTCSFSGGALESDSRSSSRASLEDLSQSRHRETSSVGMKQKMMLEYNIYMAKYINPPAPLRSPNVTDSPGHSPESSPKTTKKVRERMK